MKASCLAPLVSIGLVVGLVGAARAAVPNGLSDLYIDAAAVAMHCSGQSLSTADAAALARNIATASGARISGTALLQRIARAKRAFVDDGGNCASPFARVHIQFFANVMPQTASTGRDISPLGTTETR